MQIYGPNYIHGPQALRAPHAAPTPAPQEATKPVGAGDQLDISPAAELLNKLNDLPEIRAEKVQTIREALAQGTYDTPDKLDLALERLLDEIG
jgi:negative regulator of flagellin synthesis FlgM